MIAIKPFVESDKDLPARHQRDRSPQVKQKPCHGFPRALTNPPPRKLLWAASSAGTGSRVNVMLDKSVFSAQLRHSSQEMGLVANLLVPTNLHALRKGAAADVAHLPAASNLAGFVTHEVRQFLNHSNSTFAHGVTERYLGDFTREFWNARVGLKGIYRWWPVGLGFDCLMYA